MKIVFHKNFKKSIKQQSLKIQTKFKKKFKIFENNQFHYSLNNHALRGSFKGLRSFNISGDVRVHYKIEKDLIVFVDIGSHSELY